MTTPDLIDRLASGVTPVRRLRRPAMRAAGWLVLASIIAGLLIAGQGIRPDFRQSLADPGFLIGLAAAVLTGVCSATAAFMLSLPDRSRGWALLPLPSLALWLSTIGYQCLTNWIAFDPDGMRWGETARCFATLVLASLPLSLAILVMLRYAALLRPSLVTVTAGLAVSAITAAIMSLIHNFDSSILILIWNFGVAAVIVGLSGTLGRRMLAWFATRLTLPQG
ncbi:MAG TPA: DUF1109 domain-containing protein [Stellaceae bacterium]|nr:DUF1109 domain-containing protein [Stellaceae bacterium]